jgi:hypothetical protein
MDAVHLNVNKPVFCCPSGALASAQPRPDPFREFEQLFLSGQIGGSSTGNDRCRCRSLFSRCEHSTGSRFGAVLRKFVWLPGKKSTGSSGSGSRSANRNSSALRNKVNGKPVITVMHETLVKNNIPIGAANQSNDPNRLDSNQSTEPNVHTCTANGIQSAQPFQSMAASSTQSIHRPHRCDFDFKLPPFTAESNSYQDSTLTKSSRSAHRKQVKSEV